MLSRLKNSEKNIASIAIAMFVGSWLLLLCQTCFATLQDSDLTSYSQEEIVKHCHTIDSETATLKGQCSSHDDCHSNGDYCSGTCDYDEITVLLNSVEKTGHSDKFQKKVSIDSIFASISFKNKTASDFTPHKLLLPEKAILLPLQHYTVLLN
jgi:hypothetical protein